MISNGIDLVEIKRIEKSIKSESFLKRVYGENELRELKKKSTQSYAGAFAAKEAFSKALGSGIVGFSLNEVEVLHKENGEPYFFLSGRAKKTADEKGLSFAVSITHTGEYAAAVVTAYTEK